MTIKRLFALLIFAAAAHAQTNPFDVEAGYRWLDLKGSSGMYRTQINGRGGFPPPIFSLAVSNPVGRDPLLLPRPHLGPPPRRRDSRPGGEPRPLSIPARLSPRRSLRHLSEPAFLQ